MTTETDKFALAVAKFAKKAGVRQDAVVRKVVLDIGTRVVARSPVGNPSLWKHPATKGYTGGRFRANWQYGEGFVPTGVLEAKDKSGSNTIASIARQLRPEGAALRVHYLTNNLPYAMRLETGWSTQAPSGMVAITVREFQNIVSVAAKTQREAE